MGQQRLVRRPTIMYTYSALSFMLLSATTVFANSVLYPIAAQLPLIARVNGPYTWSIAPSTFLDPSNVTATHLPSWLSFSNFTFSGTPSAADEGTASITVAAGDTSDDFTICVTHYPPPVLKIPLAQQFNSSNPSFSSVFLLHPGSALASSVPALRVPPNWSFSVGFEGGTFTAASLTNVTEDGSDGDFGDLFYDAVMVDGTPLPSWLTFSPHTITFNGVTRSPPAFDPERVSVVLVASDQEGYSAYKAPFDIIVASHELSVADPQPVLPINATLNEPLDFSFRDNDWVFGGVAFDNRSLSATNITSLLVDTSGTSWLSYDAASMTLSGTPPGSSTNRAISLPISLSAANQSLSLNTTLALTPSYFTNDMLKPSFVSPGSSFTVSLAEYISNDPSFQGHPVDLNATYDPSVASSFLQLSQSNTGSSMGWYISGTIPSNVTYSHVNATITAYDHITHASSHTTGLIEFHTGGHSVSSAAALRKKRILALGLSVGFSIVGGIVALIGMVAICRKWCTAGDTAVDPYAHEKAYVIEPDSDGYGWTEKLGIGLGFGGRGANEATTEAGGAIFERVESQSLRTLSAQSPPPPNQNPSSPYHGIGLGAPARTVKKSAFFEGIKTTVRKFSGISARERKKATISGPIMMLTKDSAGSVDSMQKAGDRDALSPYHMNLPNAATSNVALAGSLRSVDGLEVDGISLGMGSSPTSSTGQTGRSGGSAKSVPRRRPDFGPPRATLGVTPAVPGQAARQPAYVRLPKKQDNRRSRDSQHSESSGDVEEAVIATASRAPSVRSAHSSYSYVPGAQQNPTRPRLVQFTSAKGVPVPVPSLPSAYANHGGAGTEGVRRVSHVASVYDAVDDAARHDAILTEGMRYVRAFGDQNEDLEPTFPPNLTSTARFSSPSQSARSRPATASSNAKTGTSAHSHSPVPTHSSYIYPSPSASFDSIGDASAAGAPMSRILVGTGEAFAFKFPVSVYAAPPGARSANNVLAAKLLHGGGKLPVFLSYSHTPASGRTKREEVEFWGTPGVRDIGDVVVGVFDERGECVGRLVVEVVGRG